MKFLGIDLARQEDSSVLTFSNGSSIKLIKNKVTNIRGLRSNLISLLCTCPTCGEEYWKQFDLRYNTLPPIIDDKYILPCSLYCLNNEVNKQ
jgi:hypothetical protein